MSFNYTTKKSCMKYIRVQCVDPTFQWMVRASANGASDYLHLYYHAAKAYTLEEFNDFFNVFKEKCPDATAFLEHDVGFEKWSWSCFSGNRFNVMTINIVESLNAMLLDEREYPVSAIIYSIAHRFGKIYRKKCAEVNNSRTPLVPKSEKILRKNMTRGGDDKLYVSNINGTTNEFTMLCCGPSTKVNL
ncbi:hypothetical protein T459_28220 [Capsicum annuum]|uniref:Uncharacterized protein n=1 Tax=Capsicum annuum TaxID=4072 RepID=A0A2G2YG50_CAPAN|nr:hypothetical protein T459_28220 [Capsicum annuum]